jgi:adenine deaminase
MSVIQAATINAARALGLENRLGSIDIGKEADILIINGDPISDIRNLRNIELVMKEGVIYDPIILLNSAQNKIGPESSEDHHEWELKIDSLRQ